MFCFTPISCQFASFKLFCYGIIKDFDSCFVGIVPCTDINEIVCHTVTIKIRMPILIKVGHYVNVINIEVFVSWIFDPQIPSDAAAIGSWWVAYYYTIFGDLIIIDFFTFAIDHAVIITACGFFDNFPFKIFFYCFIKFHNLLLRPAGLLIIFILLTYSGSAL